MFTLQELQRLTSKQITILHSFTLRYNIIAKEWKTNGIKQFDGLIFKVNENVMEKVTTTNGNYYPIRDECKQTTDPKQGCITTDALYYETKLNSNDKIDVLLKHGEHIIFSQSYPRHIQYVYDIYDFDCSNDKYCFEIQD